MSEEVMHKGNFYRDDSIRISMDHHFSENDPPLKIINGGEVYIKNIKESKINADILDEFMENFISRPDVISLQVVYNLPGSSEIITQIDKKNVHWTVELVPATEEKDEHIIFSLRYILNQEDWDRQIEAIRNAGIKDNYIKISDEEYIDYGEVDKACSLKYILPTNTSWLFREEPIQIGIPSEDEENENPTIIDGYVSAVCLEIVSSPELNQYGDDRGMFFLGYVSPYPMFSNDQIAAGDDTVVKSDAEKVRITTAKDCVPVVKNKEDFATEDEFKAYVEAEHKRCDAGNVYWKRIFSSKSPLVSESVRAYALEYIEHNTPEGETFSGEVEIFREGFEEFLKKKEIFETVMKDLEEHEKVPEFAGLKPEDVQPSEEAAKIMYEYQQIIPEWNKAFIETGTKFGCVEVDASGKMKFDQKSEKFKEFTEIFLNMDVCKKASNIVHRYITQLMKDSGSISPEFFETASDEEIKVHPMYREIAATINQMTQF